MPAKTALRQRQPAKRRGRDAAECPDTPPTPVSLNPRALLVKLSPFLSKLSPLLQLASACVFGALSASSLTSPHAAVALFVLSIVCFLFVLLIVFMSILRRKDPTSVPRPTLFHVDGSVTKPPPMTAHEHDLKLATYYASEFPALAMAAAWMFIWAGFRPVFLLFVGYLVFRIWTHPLFRIHFWKEHTKPELERPFGAVPLFRAGEEGEVRHVAGAHEFWGALRGAGKDRVVVVDFSAAWCNPCRALAPKFRELAVEFSNRALFLAVDVDQSQDLAKRMKITSVPSIVLFRDSDRLELLRGPSQEVLRETVRRYV